MRTARRCTAIATAFLALSAGASASSVTLDPIDFEDVGQKAISAKNPVAVTSAAKGVLEFSGAWGYAWGMLDANEDPNALPGEFDPKDGSCSAAPCNTGGFVINRNRGASNGSDLILKINRKLPGYASAYFESITFDLFAYANDGVEVYVYGGSRFAFSDNFGATDGNAFWVRNEFVPVINLLDNVDEIEFRVTSSTMGFDNLRVTLGGVTLPPTVVPEPSSYALVGLALLAAGAARRRKA